MWVLHNFVHQFRDSFHRKVDQEFAPNSGTELGEDVKQWMEDPYQLRTLRKELGIAVENLKQSLHELEAVNKRSY